MVEKTFETFAQKPASKKAILAHLEPTQRLVLWTLDAGAVYKRSVDFFVVNVFIDTTELTKGTSKTLNAGEWFFDYTDKNLYVRMGDDSNPESSFVVGQYRLFFSDTGYILSHDLTDDGNEVEYGGYILSSSNFKQEIDNAEMLGISLESNGSIQFNNNSGFFDSIFDKLFWKTARIYSWFPETPFSEAKLVFEGEIENKSFTDKAVTFRVKDFIYRLRQPVSLDLFSDSDGTISADVSGVKYKRRLYGQTNGVQLQSLDQVLDGFELTGTISAVAASQTITGVGTSFFSEASPGDEININLELESFSFKIDSIESDTSMTVSEEVEKRFSGVVGKNKPEIPYRRKNRTLHIAGHKLREPTTTIISAIQSNRFTMDTTDFFVNDIIKVGSESAKIKRISDNVVVLFQSLDTFPTIGQTVTKNPIRAAYFDQKEFLIDRDYTVSNTTSDAKIILDDLAEFNISKPKKTIGTINFSNGSRDVIGSGSSFEASLKPRDWIQSNDTFHKVWYEVLEIVDDINLKLRTVYTGSTFGGPAKQKNVNYIGDDAIVTVDCIGKEDSSGKWVKTASDIVLDLIENDAEIPNIDLASFADAKINADYIMSLKLPLTPTGGLKTIRSIISMVNESIFGSLVAKSDFKVSYNVLTPDKPNSLEQIGDDDLIGGNQNNFSVSTKSDVRRKITINYNHFDADRFTGGAGNDSIENINPFVDNLIGTKNEKTVEAYLFDPLNAATIAERYALIHSLSQNVITIKTKLNLTLRNLNDKIYIKFSRIFQRFGGAADRRKIGIISKISRGPTTTTVSFSDLSNQFNRVGTIADDSSDEFTLASDDAKILNGYVVDDDTELPDSASDEQWNTNLIG